MSCSKGEVDESAPAALVATPALSTTPTTPTTTTMNLETEDQQQQYSITHPPSPSAYHRDPSLSPRSPSISRSQLLQSIKSNKSFSSNRTLRMPPQQQQQHLQSNVSEEEHEEEEFPLLYSMCYRGFEVIFASARTTTETTETTQDVIRILHARTRLPAAVVAPAPAASDANSRTTTTSTATNTTDAGAATIPMQCGERIIAMTGNSHTGQVIVVTTTSSSNKILHLYQISPHVASCTKYTHGKYLWKIQTIWDASDVFLWDAPPPTTTIAKEKEVHLSLSTDKKLLVAYNDQLAVFDVSYNSYHGMKDKNNDPLIHKASHIIAWTTKLSSPILCSDMSADGTVIAYALQQQQQQSTTPHGVHTFVRDYNDGSVVTKEKSISTTTTFLSTTNINNNNIVGVVYKPHHFLSTIDNPISSLKWRGQGDNMVGTTSEEKNDLLLVSTTCTGSNDEFVVFSQSCLTRGELYRWIAPPFSIATWVGGISTANLGDLTDKKTGAISNEDIAMGSEASKATAAVNTTTTQQQQSTTTTTTTTSTKQYYPSGSHSLTTATPAAAGAWICEVTFRGSFPALRLSRLNFGINSNTNKSSASSINSTNNPVHIESVAVILPPGALPNLPTSLSLASSKKKKKKYIQDIFQMNVQGIWSSWDVPSDTCFNSNSTTNHHPIAPLDGSHSPPSELRLIASHADWGRNIISVLDFPLWGESDLGINVEFGTPIRHLLSLSPATNNTCQQKKNIISLQLPCSTLVARISNDGTQIHLENRIIGSTSILPLHHNIKHHDEDEYFYDSSTAMQRFVDVSATPLPNILPSLHTTTTSTRLSSSMRHYSSSSSSDHHNNNVITFIHWWPNTTTYGYNNDESINNNNTTLLLALTQQGTLILYEIPPPYVAAEQQPTTTASMMSPTDEINPIPTMIVQSANDPNNVIAEGLTTISVIGDNNTQIVITDSSAFQQQKLRRAYYEVILSPHVDFGIGLRLESRLVVGTSQQHFEIAIAGSFKKHPLTGLKLPAEKSGMITLGDTLIGVNDVDLSTKSFDEIIEIVRHVGSNAAKASLPLKLKFKPSQQQQQLVDMDSGSTSSTSPQRRTIEEILGIKSSSSKISNSSNSDNIPKPADPVLLWVSSFSCEEEDEEEEASAFVNEDEHHHHQQLETTGQQEFGRIVGLLQLNTTLEQQGLLSEELSCSIVLPWNLDEDYDNDLISCLLITVHELTLIVSKVTLTSSDNNNNNWTRQENESNNSNSISCTLLGKYVISSCTSDNKIQSLTQVSSSKKSWCLAATTNVGMHILIFMDYVDSAAGTASCTSISFREYNGLTTTTTTISSSNNRSDAQRQHTILFRSSSLALFAALATDDNNKKQVVTVWLMKPSCEVASMNDDGQKDGDLLVRSSNDAFYISYEVELPFPTLVDERIVDIRWLSPFPTMLNSYPQLVLWTTERAIVYRRTNDDALLWNPILDLQYCESWRNNPLLIGSENPHIIWPHLTSALKSLISNNNSSAATTGTTRPLFSSLSISDNVQQQQQATTIRADWHPDVLVASILLDPNGLSVLSKKKCEGNKRNFVAGVIHWLSRWNHPDESERPLWENHVWNATEWKEKVNTLEKNAGVGNVIPLTTLHISSLPDNNNATTIEHQPEQLVENAANLMALLQMKPVVKSANNAKFDGDEKLLQDFLDTIKKYIKSQSIFATKETTSAAEEKKSMITSLATNHRPSYTANGDKNSVLLQPQVTALPRPVASFNLRELACLYGIICFYHSQPKFVGLDIPAQMALFSMEVCRHITSIDEDGDGSAMTAKSREAQGFLNALAEDASKTKNSATFCSFSSRNAPTLASGVALCALVSNCQLSLLSRCSSLSQNLPGGKMDWSTARRLLIPFWLRDTSELRRLSEEIALNTFRSTRDIMECALLFVAMRKMSTLTNLARTDDTLSGKTFFKFLQNHDFSSEAGRKAAEKNAYSLLRKRRYGVAAAFFLLAEPPMLKTALEVIAGSMEDVGLALMVARLIEDSRGHTQIGGIHAGGMGKGSSGFGGGGGFASISSTAMDSDSNEQPFSEWSPKLDMTTRNMLKGHGLDKALLKNDVTLAAILHIWLGERDLSILSLVSSKKDVGLMFPQPSLGSCFNIDRFFPLIGKGKAAVRQASTSFLGDVVTCLNAHLNFGCRYLTLRAINAPQRAQWCSLLQIATVYSRSGFEISSITALQCLQPEEEVTVKGEAKVSQSSANTSFSSSHMLHSNVPKSTLELPKNTPFLPTPAGMGSSIFDSFESPPWKPKAVTAGAAKVTVSSGEMSSSIFDNFDAVPQRPKVKVDGLAKVSESSGEMCSSIFDMFDAAPQKPNVKKTESATGEMSSSIFDSFDAAPPKQKPKAPGNPAAKVVGQTPPSIFDSFDVGPQMTNPKSIVVSSSSNNTMLPSESTNFKIKPVVVDFGRLPDLWREWKAELLSVAVARRLLREISRVCSLFSGDLPDPALHRFRRSSYPLVPHGAAEVLSHACDVDIVTGLQGCLEELCSLSGIILEDIVRKAFNLLGDSDQMNAFFPESSILCSVILYSIIQREDLAEKVVADVSRKQIQLCASFGIANDEFRFHRSSKLFMSNHIMRRSAVQTSWQLELCLWLHRGGNVSLAADVLKEAIVAVRVGLLLGSWAICHETVDNIIRCDPDCALDYQSGRQLWTCWKIMNNVDEKKKKNSRCGGWEFLVDCKRPEASDMLRNKRAGTFLLRPHPDDHGVFTLSFKTNLIPTKPGESVAKPIEADDVIQHAIVRLSDAGFRCGSFGPFGSLMKLLEAVSESLPFALLFDEPPSEGIIKDKGEQPSPNSILIRKSALQSKTLLPMDPIQGAKDADNDVSCDYEARIKDCTLGERGNRGSYYETLSGRRRIFGIFTQLLALTEVTKQLCAVYGANIDDVTDDNEFRGSFTEHKDEENRYTMSSRALRPLLEWRRTLEIELANDLGPSLYKSLQALATFPVAVAATDTAIEAIPSVSVSGSAATGGDALIRSMIQLGSGVECRTLRVGEGWNSAMVVLFSRNQAISWIVLSGTEKDPADAAARLKLMEEEHVIESLNLVELSALWQNKKVDSSNEELSNIRYRFVDPWEVEPLESRESELAEIFLGRECYIPFSVSTAARACEKMQQAIGGLELLSLWGTVKGGIFLTKAISCMLPPWERDAGSDLQTIDGAPSEPTPYISSIRKHLYRNQIFRSLNLPQRFLTLVQVELLDLKNLTAPGGTSQILAYSILRLKRPSSSAPLSHKAKTLDCATTSPKKIGKSSGPLAPASWGCLVRFRYPLPEDVNCDGISFDAHREAIFKGPPLVLHLVVYEKKFMTDLSLGVADVSLDALRCGGHLEEWVPLRAGKSGTTWFIRIRITLRFELMCITSTEKKKKGQDNTNEAAAAGGEVDLSGAKISKLSVGMKKIAELSLGGGLHEDTKSVKRIESSPDFFGYLESMVG